MLAPSIQTFLDERKENWLKKKINNKTTAEEESLFKQQANDLFSLASWLPDAAKRAKQLSLTSHPAKFSHPNAKTTPIIAAAEAENDGYLRTGNLNKPADVFGNAAAMDVYKFLKLPMQDGRDVLTHLEQKTPEIQKQFSLPTAGYQELEQGLLAIKDSNANEATHARVKQVYFPVEDDYHLLSVLTPSSLMFALKQRINQYRFSEEVKTAREAKRNNQYYEDGFAEIYQLSVIGYGGTKPQNISVLNNQNGGTAYLLESLPPIFDKRNTNPPRSNFFSDSLKLKNFKPAFDKLHQHLIKLNTDRNNKPLRNKRDWMIKNILYQVADILWQIRYLKAGWSDSDRYANLPQSQKIWLDQYYQNEREQLNDWQDDIKTRLARWLVNAYSRSRGKEKAYSIDDGLYKPHFIRLIDECEGALL